MYEGAGMQVRVNGDLIDECQIKYMTEILRFLRYSILTILVILQVFWLPNSHQQIKDICSLHCHNSYHRRCSAKLIFFHNSTGGLHLRVPHIYLIFIHIFVSLFIFTYKIEQNPRAHFLTHQFVEKYTSQQLSYIVYIQYAPAGQVVFWHAPADQVELRLGILPQFRLHQGGSGKLMRLT